MKNGPSDYSIVEETWHCGLCMCRITAHVRLEAPSWTGQAKGACPKCGAQYTKELRGKPSGAVTVKGEGKRFWISAAKGENTK